MLPKKTFYNHLFGFLKKCLSTVMENVLAINIVTIAQCQTCPSLVKDFLFNFNFSFCISQIYDIVIMELLENLIMRNPQY